MLRAVCGRISELSKEKNRLLIAIDGRCGSGKSTLAAALKASIGCAVVPMDDFFLTPQLRTRERLMQPGGNIDYERVLSNALLPLYNGNDAVYRPYLCHDGSYADAVAVPKNAITVFEGTYSCHPELIGYYDLKIFLTLPPKRQLERLEARDHGRIEAFQTMWIPLEEKYFAYFETEKRCDMVFVTG